jgi:hypothetical protein
VLWAVEHEDTEVWVGTSTVIGILANRVAPRILDRYLARTGYRAQQWDGLADPGRPDNLWTPVAGDHGAHGDFDNRARRQSVQFWLRKHRRALSVVGAGIAGVLGAAALAGRGRHDRRQPSIASSRF